jgi:AbrB family looped-hinge helix DNA binding protein
MEVRSKAKITSKGQITLPVAVRERLGVGTGDTVTFLMTSEGIFLNKETDPSVFAKWEGRFRKGKGKSAEEINRFIREMRGHDDE